MVEDVGVLISSLKPGDDIDDLQLDGVVSKVQKRLGQQQAGDEDEHSHSIEEQSVGHRADEEQQQAGGKYDDAMAWRGDAAGHVPVSYTHLFLIFKDDQGGDPLYAETQNVTLDSAGRYKVHLGASLSSGLPTDLFANGDARWLEVQIPGQNPQPRALLVSVPYALKAADASTLGGLPASAFVLASSQAAANAATPALAVQATPNTTTTTATRCV